MALREASAVLYRLAEKVEDGTLTASSETQLVIAAAWHGAADALESAASAMDDLTG